MTESEWLASDDPARMLQAANSVNGVPFGFKISDRKLRLFACACARQVWDRTATTAPCPTCKGSGGVKYSGRIAPIEMGPTGLREMKEKCHNCSGKGRINRSHRAVEVAERYADGLVAKEEALAAHRAAWDAWQRINGCVATTAESLAVDCLCKTLSFLWDNPRTNLVPAETQAALLRDIAGNPWRKVELPKRCLCGWADAEKFTTARGQVWLCVDCGQPGICPWLTHNDGAVRKIARVIYDTRNFDLMPMLTDALEEAGCPSETLYEGPLGSEWLCSKCESRVELKNTYEQGNLRQEYACPRCGWRDKHVGVKGTRTICEPHPILAHLRGPGPHARGCHVLDLLLGRD